MSLTKWDGLVADGSMPQPKMVGSRTIWDRHRVDLAFDALPDREPQNASDKREIALAKFRLLDGTGVITLKHTVEDVDRHGNVQSTSALQIRKKIRLREPVGSQAFVEEHKAAVLGKPESRRSTFPPPRAPSNG